MSLFAHLAVRFGSHPENLATEALGYILGASRQARLGFIASLGGDGRALPPELRFSNQVSTKDAGRPDLAAHDEAGNLRLLVEAKFWAGFTDHQPLSYLDQLPAGGVLVVLGPGVRLPYMHREIVQRVAAAKRGLTSQEATVDLIRGAIDGRHLVVASWQRVLKAMSLELASEPSALADVAQLLGLCERMDSEAFIPVTGEELTTNVYRRVHEFGLLVDEAISTLSARGVVNTKGLKSGASNGYYGRYARLRGVAVLLHVSTWKWTKFAPTPVWLTVYGRTFQRDDAEPIKKLVLAALDLHQESSVFRDRNEDVTIAIRVPVGAERHEILASLVEQVARIGDIFTPLAVQANNSVPPPDDASESLDS